MDMDFKSCRGFCCGGLTGAVFERRYLCWPTALSRFLGCTPNLFDGPSFQVAFVFGMSGTPPAVGGGLSGSRRHLGLAFNYSVITELTCHARL